MQTKTPRTYRKKPVEVEAMQLNGETLRIVKWMAANGSNYRTKTHPTDSTQDVIFVPTLEGEMRADPGDWIIRGVEGEFYPCKPHIFEATYELAGNAAPVDAERERMLGVVEDLLRERPFRGSDACLAAEALLREHGRLSGEAK